MSSWGELYSTLIYDVNKCVSIKNQAKNIKQKQNSNVMKCDAAMHSSDSHHMDIKINSKISNDQMEYKLHAW